MGEESAKSLSHEFGLFAEEIASREYIKMGYAILERNWRLGKTEIDIIAQKENTVVLIEVKARSGKDMDPLETVTKDKRRRMIKAADAYLSRMTGNISYRFDIFTLTGNMKDYTTDLLEDAFVAADLF